MLVLYEYPFRLGSSQCSCGLQPDRDAGVRETGGGVTQQRCLPITKLALTGRTVPSHHISTGNPEAPIWLIGDSAPEREQVRFPLDPRHPTRHTIWTPVLEAAQDVLFGHGQFRPRRLSPHGFHVRNAVRTAACKSNHESVGTSMAELRALYGSFRPRTIITFGSFAFQFTVTAVESDMPCSNFRAKSMSVRQIRSEFDARAQSEEKVVVPLLHQIVGLQPQKSHEPYLVDGTDNYFEYVGRHLAHRFLRMHAGDPCWREYHESK